MNTAYVPAPTTNELAALLGLRIEKTDDGYEVYDWEVCAALLSNGDDPSRSIVLTASSMQEVEGWVELSYGTLCAELIQSRESVRGALGIPEVSDCM
ncbi:hypothetical protein RR49_00580 [Microbacterium ginsengisoli]|jgi:hypothetical protein|uniref:Uncharacterized protein n=1 Tax=Microbacterium ginsengisoli TaxID=400772 RepID=A0A0F0M2A9_9MICO|nr:hypothetical protein [Microbacterium ginsengisoli]KJL39007.1 hypothetical protein RR49_00580 [Microbacterium ginsengisoli]MBN9209763.1 hypothetical protein [Microbacterium ginsengisoli]